MIFVSCEINGVDYIYYVGQNEAWHKLKNHITTFRIRWCVSTRESIEKDLIFSNVSEIRLELFNPLIWVWVQPTLFQMWVQPTLVTIFY